MAETKSIEQKKIQGTARKDRMPKNPIVSLRILKVPKCPELIETDFGKKKWRGVCEILISENRLFVPDLDLVLLYVSSFEMWYKAKQEVNLLKLDIMTKQTNKVGEEYQAVNKWEEKIRQYSAEIVTIGRELCLSQKVKAKASGLGGGGKEENPLAKLLQRQSVN